MSSLGVVASGAAADAIAARVPELVDAKFASCLFAQDATLWGPEAESEAAIRLSWVNLPRSSRPLLGEISALRDQLRAEGVDRIVLCGMGGSSLAPEVICATAGVDLVVLDSSQPDMVRDAIQLLTQTKDFNIVLRLASTVRPGPSRKPVSRRRRAAARR